MSFRDKFLSLDYILIFLVLLLGAISCIAMYSTEKGNFGYYTESHLYKEVKELNNYLIVSEWSSKEAFDNFIASDKFKNVTNWGKEQILMGRPKHQVYKH